MGGIGHTCSYCWLVVTHLVHALAMLVFLQPAWQANLSAATIDLDCGLSLAVASQAEVNTCFEGKPCLDQLDNTDQQVFHAVNAAIMWPPLS
jgi:hypothetical protein